MATIAQVPLEIKFIDPIRPVKVGREFRFEVLRTDRPNERVSFDQLDFAFAPVTWGVVGRGAEAGTGVVKIVALAKSKDVYDRPKYEMTAAYKARGDTSLEAGNQFAVAFGPPVVELRFYMREDDPSTEEIEYEQFDPQQQAARLEAKSFAVEPASAADIFEEGGRFYARIHDPRAKALLTVTFPNGDKATAPLDVRLAGKTPQEIARLVPSLEAEPADDAVPADATATDTSLRSAAPPSAPARAVATGEDSVAGDRTEIDTRPRPSPVAAPTSPAPRAEAAANNAAMPSAATMPATAPQANAQGGAPAKGSPANATANAAAAAARVDPSFSLRNNMTHLRREIDAAMADGLIPVNARAKLQQKLGFFRDATKNYKGPDVQSVQDFFERTLGDVKFAE